MPPTTIGGIGGALRGSQLQLDSICPELRRIAQFKRATRAAHVSRRYSATSTHTTYRLGPRIGPASRVARQKHLNLAIGYYDGETFVAAQLAVQVSCIGTLCIDGMAGYYLAGELDEYGTHLFTKDEVSTLDTTWRIHNSGCGWKIEEGTVPEEGPVYDWTTRATTQCSEESECTGSCRTEDALTTDEDVPGYSLALGYYDGETFVAA